MHGLFLTCTQKFYIYIYTTHNQLFGHKQHQPSLKGKGKTPYLLGRLTSCSWWRIPIHSDPLSGINCPSLTFQSPLTPTHSLGPYYITMTTLTTSVFLSGTVLSIHQSCDRGEGRIWTVNLDIYSVRTEIWTSQLGIHALNKVYNSFF
jgi:hypothetical protein